MNIAPKPCPFCGETRTRLMTTNTECKHEWTPHRIVGGWQHCANCGEDRDAEAETNPTTPAPRVEADALLDRMARASKLAHDYFTQTMGYDDRDFMVRSLSSAIAEFDALRAAPETPANAERTLLEDFYRFISGRWKAAPQPASQAVSAEPCAVCDGPNTYDPESGVCARCQDVVDDEPGPAQSADTPSEAVPPIEANKFYKDRFYIPLPGGWEIQTKGSGSSFRICDTKSGWRFPITPQPYLYKTLERMGREIHAAWVALASRPQPARGEVSEAEVEAALAAYYASFQCGKESGVYYDEQTRKAGMRAALEAAARVRGK
jgi:hypothetical protein